MAAGATPLDAFLPLRYTRRMTRDSKPDRPGGDMPAEPRAARLKAALKANIAKRKAHPSRPARH